jgi:hypothetical protein
MAKPLYQAGNTPFSAFFLASLASSLGLKGKPALFMADDHKQFTFFIRHVFIYSSCLIINFHFFSTYFE